MPGGDRTGPMGAGPMTGRQAGFCAGNDVAGYMSAPGGGRFGMGGGLGRGGRRGRGRRLGFFGAGPFGWQRAAAPATGQAAMGKEQQLDALRQQAEAMEQQMKQLHERIARLEGDA